MEAGFLIVVLTREAEVVGDALDVHLAVAEGIIDRRPDHQPVGPDELLGRSLVVVLVPEVGAPRLEKEGIGGKVGIRCIAVGPQLVARSIIFPDQAFIRV